MYRELPTFSPDEVLEYLRKSRSDDPTLTVEEVLLKHETILRDWAERNLDAPIPAENVYREVVSGETIEGRPEMQKLLERIESPKIKAILTVEVQRLSRGDLEDCGRLIKLLRYTRTKVITPYKIYDLEDEYDRDAFERELKRGNEYLEYYKKIQKRGKEVSVQEGNFTGATAPYGYQKTKVTVGKKKCPTLEIIEAEARIVRLIFNWYANEGIGAERIAQRLNEMGIRPQRTSIWKKTTIMKMLRNEVYIGKVRRGYRVATHKVLNQEIIKGTRYNSDYDVYEGKHEAIIDDELFYRIQNKRSTLPKHKIGTELRNPLVSILRCKCGSYMECKLHRGKLRYICGMQQYCHNSSVLLTDVMAELSKYLTKCIEDFTLSIENTDDNLYDQHEAHIRFLESKFAEAEKKELSLWEKYSEEGMPKAVFDKLRAKCEDEKQTLEKAIAKAYQDMPVKIDYQEKIMLFHDVLDALNNDDVSAEVKNKLLKTIIDRIEYSRPQAVRMLPAEAAEKGVTTENGWYNSDFEMDIYLRI